MNNNQTNVPSIQAIQPLANAIQTLMAEMNREFAMISIGNKIRVLREYSDPVTGEKTFALLSVQDFLALTSNRPSGIDSSPSAGHVWLKHPHRRQYLALDFLPGETPDGLYNLWRGFPVEPVKGDTTPYWEFVREVICNSNEENYRFLRKWMAHLIQKPDKLPEVAIVLRGLQGTGKSTFSQILGQLVAPHYIELSGMHQVTGKFNSHLAGKLIVNANEAIWGGHKSAEGALKAMITDPTIAIEGKGRDIIQIRNYVRVIVTTNEAWAVPMAADDRRFLVLDVSDRRKEDHAYFSALRHHLEKGGLAALMYDLQDEDLSEFNPRNVPASADGFDLKLRGVDSVTQWLHEVLNTGYYEFTGIRVVSLNGNSVVGNRSVAEIREANEQGIAIATEWLHESYVQFCAENRIRPETKALFIRRLKQLAPYLTSTRPTTGTARTRSYFLPSLKEAREAFELLFKLPRGIPWEDPREQA